MLAPPVIVPRGKTVLNIEWQGHRISSADELYHTTWHNIEGVGSLLAPCECTVAAFNEEALSALVRQPAKAAAVLVLVGDQKLAIAMQWRQLRVCRA